MSLPAEAEVNLSLCVRLQDEPVAEGTLAGHVKKVRVEAFKCHDHFEVELGCVNILPLQTPEHMD